MLAVTLLRIVAANMHLIGDRYWYRYRVLCDRAFTSRIVYTLCPLLELPSEV